MLWRQLETKVSHATAQELRSSASEVPKKASSLGGSFSPVRTKRSPLAREDPRHCQRLSHTTLIQRDHQREHSSQSWISSPLLNFFFLLLVFFCFFFHSFFILLLLLLFQGFNSSFDFFSYLCVCVCVCVFEKKRKSERTMKETKKKEE